MREKVYIKSLLLRSVLNFNTISTPLYAFLMSVGLLFFNNYIMFILE